MNTIHKTYRFRLIPDAAQQTLLAKHFGCVRVVYNHFLNERIEQYKKNKRSDNYHAQTLALTQGLPITRRQDDSVYYGSMSVEARSPSIVHIYTSKIFASAALMTTSLTTAGTNMVCPILRFSVCSPILT